MSNPLKVTIYEDDGAVIFGMESDDGQVEFPLTPGLADEIADLLKREAKRARKSRPENEQ